MKKLLYFILIISAILSFETTTLAFKDSSRLILAGELCPNKQYLLKERYSLPQKCFELTAKMQNTTSPAYIQTANLTVVDSNQVKVKYDIWIVKALKELFKLN